MPLYAAAIDIGFIGKKCLFTKEKILLCKLREFMPFPLDPDNGAGGNIHNGDRTDS